MSLFFFISAFPYANLNFSGHAHCQLQFPPPNRLSGFPLFSCTQKIARMKAEESKTALIYERFGI